MIIMLEMSKGDAALLLADLHRRRQDHVAAFARTDCWQDRAIYAIERGFGILAGPAEDYEARWVCSFMDGTRLCCGVNAIGQRFCRLCDQPRKGS